ncbi:sterol desaturase family protein [Variovorax sp.]|uniref:sterol desaturase family protein n=1 Tax=Variovorax sp. TaxID=1871043 RepID=UPI002D4486FD|nr:sterol desaturase family protein [Variovorax sp.]HYP84618.1 sterol desaturase family protein [Variovorax sp.]
MLDTLSDAFSAGQLWLFETVVQPLVFSAGLGGWGEDAFDATGWLLVGLVQLAVLLAVIGPLERWRPVFAVTDRSAVRTDIFYTVIHRLGLFRLLMFFVLQPFFDGVVGPLHTAGWAGWQLDAIWPGVTDLAWVSFVLYLVVLDFVDYWIHRGQHGLRWWWSLHALHHSQQQMTMWSDNRNHLLDDALRDVLIVLVAQVIGVAPGQFIALVALTQLSESLQHANLRLHFGRVGERLWVSPRFHRLHHSVGRGHEAPKRAGAPAPARPLLGGHNFGVLLPWWDVLFGTADFSSRYDPTGIRDQVEPDASGRLRDYGRGFWAQQWMGLKRLAGQG